MSSRRLALAASLATLAALTGCSEVAAGHCSGVLGGEAFEADIDPESEFHNVLRRTCSEERNKTRWRFSYGGGALQIAALSPETTNSALSGQQRSLPPPFEGAFFEEWTVLAPLRSQLAGGTLTLPQNFDFSSSTFGAFTMALADGSQLECTFSLPQGANEGSDVDCATPGQD